MNKVNKRGPFIHDWSNYNPESQEVHPLLKKTDGKVNVARANRIKSKNPEWREKISKALKGLKKPAGHGLNVSKAMKGKIKTKEHCEAIKLAKKLNPWRPTAKQIASSRQKNLGRKHTKDSKIKMSNNKKTFWDNIDIDKKLKIAKKVSETRRDTLGIPVLTPFGLFRTRAEAIEYFNDQTNTKSGRDYMMSRLMNKKFPNYKKLSKQEYENLKKEKLEFISLDYLKNADSKKLSLIAVGERHGFIQTPQGVFCTKIEAMKKHRHNKNSFIWFKKMSKDYPKEYKIVGLKEYINYNNLSAQTRV